VRPTRRLAGPLWREEPGGGRAGLVELLKKVGLKEGTSLGQRWSTGRKGRALGWPLRGQAGLAKSREEGCLGPKEREAVFNSILA